ncbi:hypothetical protein WA016_03357 [Myxococcus stipitatus]
MAFDVNGWVPANPDLCRRGGVGDNSKRELVR